MKVKNAYIFPVAALTMASAIFLVRPEFVAPDEASQDASRSSLPTTGGNESFAAATRARPGRLEPLRKGMGTPPSAEKHDPQVATNSVLPIANGHPQIRKNIRERQRLLQDYLPYVRLEVDGPFEPGNVVRAAAELATLTVLDARGRSMVVDPENPPALTITTFEHYALSNGGAIYEFVRGEFPAYDQTRDLQEEFPDGIPIGELPLAETEELMLLALSYSSQ